MKKIVYIAHPIAGDIEMNLVDLNRILRQLNLTQLDIVPFCPYYADVMSLDDNVPEERKRGLENGLTVIKSGIVKELWLTGNKISKGMEAERQLAVELNIPVRNYINVF